MSLVSKEEIRGLSRLARLRLSEEEVESLQCDLSGILEHMKALAEIDTAGVPPMTHAMPGAQDLRSDEPQASLARETIMAASQKSDGEYFIVPAILPSSDSQ